MPITFEEYENIGKLMAEIGATYVLAGDLIWFGMQSSSCDLTECGIETYDVLRKAFIGSSIKELERVVKEELIPEIRKYIENYLNPFEPNEFDDIPF